MLVFHAIGNASQIFLLFEKGAPRAKLLKYIPIEDSHRFVAKAPILTRKALIELWLGTRRLIDLAVSDFNSSVENQGLVGIFREDIGEKLFFLPRGLLILFIPGIHDLFSDYFQAVF